MEPDAMAYLEQHVFTLLQDAELQALLQSPALD